MHTRICFAIKTLVLTFDTRKRRKLTSCQCLLLFLGRPTIYFARVLPSTCPSMKYEARTFRRNPHTSCCDWVSTATTDLTSGGRYTRHSNLFYTHVHLTPFAAKDTHNVSSTWSLLLTTAPLHPYRFRPYPCKTHRRSSTSSYLTMFQLLFGSAMQHFSVYLT